MTFSAVTAYDTAALDQRSQAYLLGFLTQRLDTKGRLTKTDFRDGLEAADRYFTERAIAGGS